MRTVMAGFGEAPALGSVRSARPCAAELPAVARATLAFSGELAPTATRWAWVPPRSVVAGWEPRLARAPAARSAASCSRACAEYCACVKGYGVPAGFTTTTPLLPA